MVKYIKDLLSSFRLSLIEKEGKVNLFSIIKVIYKYSIKSYLLPLLASIAPHNSCILFHKLRGVKIGRHVFIDRTVTIDGPYPELVTIEDNARITHGVVIMAHTNPSCLLKEKGYMPFKLAKVTICNDAFIGINVVVSPGVTIGEGAVVVSGSVVIFDVPPYTVVSGNPAKKVRSLKED